MADNSKKLSQLSTASNAASTDRLLILRDPAGSPSTRTITVANLANSLPIANTTVAGTIKVGNNLSVNATGYLNAEAGGIDFDEAGAINLVNHGVIRNITDSENVNLVGSGYVQLQWTTANGAAEANPNDTTEPKHWIYVDAGGAAIQTNLNGEGDDYTWGFTNTGIMTLPNDIGDIQRNGVSVLVPTMLSPNISYTGVFNGYPASLPVTKGQAVFFTGNNYVLETTNKYWLATRFDNNDYDLSGAETIDLNNIGGIMGNFRLGGKGEVLLTDVNLHDITVINDYFYVRDLPALTTFSANNLTYVENYFEIDNMDNVGTQFNFPNLKTVETFYYIWNDVLENTPQFPALENIKNAIYIYYNSAPQYTFVFDSLRYFGYAGIYQNDGIASGPSFPALTSLDYFDMYSNINLTSPPLFPVLETVLNSFYFYNNGNVTTAPALPSLVSANYMNFTNNTSMVNGFDFSALKHLNGNFTASGCALDETSVDYILTTLAALDGTNGTTSYNNYTISLDGGTNSIPSASGLAAKAVLEGRGCVVYVNS